MTPVKSRVIRNLHHRPRYRYCYTIMILEEFVRYLYSNPDRVTPAPVADGGALGAGSPTLVHSLPLHLVPSSLEAFFGSHRDGFDPANRYRTCACTHALRAMVSCRKLQSQLALQPSAQSPLEQTSAITEAQCSESEARIGEICAHWCCQAADRLPEEQPGQPDRLFSHAVLCLSLNYVDSLVAESYQQHPNPPSCSGGTQATAPAAERAPRRMQSQAILLRLLPPAAIVAMTRIAAAATTPRDCVPAALRVLVACGTFQSGSGHQFESSEPNIDLAMVITLGRSTSQAVRLAATELLAVLLDCSCSAPDDKYAGADSLPRGTSMLEVYTHRSRAPFDDSAGASPSPSRSRDSTGYLVPRILFRIVPV